MSAAFTSLHAVGRWTLEDPNLLWLGLSIPAVVWLRRRRGDPAIPFTPGLDVGAVSSSAVSSSAVVSSVASSRTSPPGSSPRSIPASIRARCAAIPGALHVVGVVLLLVALARPQDRTPLPLEADGVDILLCIDLSSSMTETDMAPAGAAGSPTGGPASRLEVARRAARRFVADRPHDRIGLVGFARFADVICPPTRDHEALAAFLDDLRPSAKDGPEDQTAIGGAVALCARVLRAGESPSKVVVLITDGEENVATVDAPEEIGPLPAAQLCEAFGVKVHTVVAGRGRRAPGGTWVALDTAQVRQVAERTGGRLLEARDQAAMEDVYATIHALETTRFREPRFEVEDRFLAFVIAGLAFLLASSGLRSAGLEVTP